MKSPDASPWPYIIFGAIAVFALVGSAMLMAWLGVPPNYSGPVSIFVGIMAFYPVIKRVEVRKPPRTPLTLTRWAMVASLAAAGNVLFNLLMER